MDLELRSLRYFVTVAETLNFSRAAEHLHMAQPPLSRQIQRLERELGVQLFERSKRSVHLTEVGELFLLEARKALSQAELAVHTARRASRGELGMLTVGFVGSASYGFLPNLIRAFRESYPAVGLTLLELPTMEQLEALQSGQISIGFLRPPVADDLVEQRVIHQEPYVVALPAKHPLAEWPEVPLSALASDRFITVPRTLAPGVYTETLSMCVKAGFQPQIVQEVIQYHVTISLVAAGMGVALVPASIQTFRRLDVAYRPIEGPSTLAEIRVVWRRADRSPVLRAFLDAMAAYG